MYFRRKISCRFVVQCVLYYLLAFIVHFLLNLAEDFYGEGGFSSSIVTHLNPICVRNNRRALLFSHVFPTYMSWHIF